MIKVLHLVSDPKFTAIHAERFGDPEFENRFIYLESEYNPAPLPAGFQSVVPFSPDYDRLLSETRGMDLVMVYNLDYPKAYFVNRIPKNLPVVWHFYGTELYNNYQPLKYEIYSKLTLQVLRINHFSRVTDQVKRRAGELLHWLKGSVPEYRERDMAIARVNRFAWYDEGEYNFLAKAIHIRLPPFLLLSLEVREPEPAPRNSTATCDVWLGNGASPENNHFDILQLLSKSRFEGKVIVPFSYGGVQPYDDYMHRQTDHSGLDIRLMTTFNDYNDYAGLLQNAGFAVFNSFRQMALGNIFLALRFGKKVYLNPRNPSYHWLQSGGFAVYSTEEHLPLDLTDHKFILEPALQQQNEAAYATFTAIDNRKRFLASISRLVNGFKELNQIRHD